MRVKRQRRKLRGKYSGNCLSCNAKWSKCWYIASAENQKEWETRLKVSVTPCDDEVCFQCWDAKIRTSPKRKIHYKNELQTDNLDISSLPAKMEMRNKKRSLSSDFEYTFSTNRSTKKARGTSKSLPKLDMEVSDLDSFESITDTSSEEEFIIEFEHAAILVLSEFSRSKAKRLQSKRREEVHALKSLGHGLSMGHGLSVAHGLTVQGQARIPALSATNNICFNLYAPASESEEFKKVTMLPENINIGTVTISEGSGGSGNSDCENKKKRGAYMCGKCGQLKKGHVCPAPASPKVTPASPDTSLKVTQPEPPKLPLATPLPIPSLTPTPIFTQPSPQPPQQSQEITLVL